MSEKTKTKKYRLQAKKAFSFIELMIVIAIISLMTGALLVNQRTNVQPKNDVDIAARQLVSLLRLQQNNALSGKQLSISGMTSVCGFGLSWDATNINTYYEAANNAPASNSVCNDSKVNYGNAVSFKNVTIAPAVNGYVFYKLPFGGMSTSLDPIASKILLTSSNGNAQHTICIYSDTIKDASTNVPC